MMEGGRNDGRREERRREGGMFNFKCHVINTIMTKISYPNN